MSSTRAELSGILAALTYLRLAMEYINKDWYPGLICMLHCDSKAALQRVRSFEYQGFGTSWRCRANYDLEVAIKDCLFAIPATVEWVWVRGHAHRRKNNTYDYTWPETLNSAADNMATEAKERAHEPGDTHWPEQAISIIGPTGRMTGHLSKQIRHSCTSRDLSSYWKDRYNWTTAQARTIDTAGTSSLAAKLSAASTRRVVKLRCGWLPVNQRESRQDPDQPEGCPACSPTGLIPETVDHIFQCCASARRKAVRDTFSR